MAEKLAYIGRVVDIEPIINADKIVSATVVCGDGGKWMGVVQKDQFVIGDNCIIFLQDSILPVDERWAFMQKYHWRVKMQRLRGVPSECLIVDNFIQNGVVGDDVTDIIGVTKYSKDIPASMAGRAEDAFPTFIPKTDEPNFQTTGKLVTTLIGKPYYITTKYDGMSCTAYKYNGEFKVCSRNWILNSQFRNNAYYNVIDKWSLENTLPDGVAIQFEVYGEGIQKNPLNISGINGAVFNVYYITNKMFLNMYDAVTVCKYLGIPFVDILEIGQDFNYTENELRAKAEGTYPGTENQREGIVIRPLTEMYIGNQRLSFKVINLLYKGD